MVKESKKKLCNLLKRALSTVAAAAMLITGPLSAGAVQFTYDWNSSDNPVFTKSFSSVS